MAWYDKWVGKLDNEGATDDGILNATGDNGWNAFVQEVASQISQRVLKVVLNSQSYSPTNGVINLGTIQLSVDASLSTSSVNAVRNSVVTAAINALQQALDGKALSTDLVSLANDVSTLSDTIATLQRSVQGKASSEDLTALTNRVATLEEDMEEVRGAATTLGGLSNVNEDVDGSVQERMVMCKDPDSDEWIMVPASQFGGGGSASTTQYQLRIVNNLSSKALVASKGETCLINYTFTSQSRESSDDPWTDTGERGYCTISVRNTGTYRTVWEGYINSNVAQSLNVANYLVSGANSVKISIEGEDSSMSAASLVYNVTLTELSVSAPNFTWWTPFSGDIVVPLIISGNISKILHVTVTGTEYAETYDIPLGTTVYTSNALNHAIPAPTNSGVYNVSIWLSNADGTLTTSRLSYNIIYVVQDDPGKYICVNNVIEKATNWAENTLLTYSIYDGGRATTSANFLVTKDSTTVYRTELVNLTTGSQQTFSIPLEVDTLDNSDFDLLVFISDDNADIVYQVTIPVDNSAGYSPMAGASFILNPKTRSNAQGNATDIINEVDGSTVAATWHDINGVTDRWVERPGVGRVLRILAGSEVEIDYRPFALEAARTGRTVEIDYICENVTDYNESIIRILTEVAGDFVGLKINPDWFTLHSSAQKSELDDNQGLYIEDGERMRFTLTIVPDAYGNSGFNIAKIYINGCMNREFTYASNDYWVNASKIRIGSGNADVDICGISVYDFALSEEGVRRNVQSRLTTTAEKEAFGAANDIFEANGTDVSLAKMIAKGGWVFVWKTEVPSYTNPNKMTADLEIYYQGELYATILDVPCTGQGTTSMLYFFWNLRWKLKGCTVVYADGSTTVGYIRFPWYDINVEDLVAKLNFASPMQSHKLGSVNLINDLTDRMGISDDIGARLAIEQRPCVIFTRITNSEGANVDTFVGLYTYGPHKGNKPTMGYDQKSSYPDMLSVEGADNGPLLTLHRVPWDDRITYDSNAGAIMRNGEKSWGYNAGAYADDEKAQEGNVKALFDRIFKPAYDAVHTNSPRIRPFAGTLEQLNAAVDTYKADTMEYWTTDGNLYYYDSATGRYVSDDGINLYEQLVDKGYGLTSQDIADAADNEALNDLFIKARKTRFRQQYGQYWNVRSVLFWICYMRFFASTDTRAKNTYWKIFLMFINGGRLTAFFDDLDTIFDFTNQGQPLKEYYVEEGDTYADGSDVWNAMTNNMPNLVEATYGTELTDMMREMMAAMEDLSGLQTGSHFDKLYACIKKYYFDMAQEYFSVSLYNVQTRVIYEAAKLAYMAGTYKNDTDPITQALGNHYSSEKRWIKKRIVYMMSKYSYGDFAASSTTDMISVRMGGGLHTFDIIPAIAMYPNIANGQSIIRGGRTMPGQTCHFEVETNGDQQINIYGAGYLKSIGDWHSKLVKGDMVVSGRMLSELVLGSANDAIVIAITGLTLSDTVSLRKLLLTNINTLSGVLDMTACTHIQEIYASGTSLTQIILPAGGALRHIEYADTNQYVQLQNFPLLTTANVQMGSALNVIDFFVDNCPQLDAFALLLDTLVAQETAGSVSLKHIRITGINSTVDSAMLDEIAKLSDGRFAGLDAEGLASDAYPLPVLQGTLTVDGSYYEDSITAIQEAFPDLTIVTTSSPYVRFEDSRVHEICAYFWGETKDIKETADQSGVLAIGNLAGNDDTLVYSDYFFACSQAISKHGDVPATSASAHRYRIEIRVEGDTPSVAGSPWDMATASAATNSGLYIVQYSSAMAAVGLANITNENWINPEYWADTENVPPLQYDENRGCWVATVTTTTAAQYLRIGVRAVAGTTIRFSIVSLDVTKVPTDITKDQCAAVTSLSNKLNSNSLLRTFRELRYFGYMTNPNLSACPNLKTIFTGRFTVIATDTALRYLPYALLPALKTANNWPFRGAAQAYTCLDVGYYTGSLSNTLAYIEKTKYIIIRNKTVNALNRSSVSGGTVFVRGDMVEAFQAHSYWSKETIASIGGNEWVTAFGSTSEYANVQYYAPDMYEWYVEEYEKAKAAANLD